MLKIYLIFVAVLQSVCYISADAIPIQRSAVRGGIVVSKRKLQGNSALLKLVNADSTGNTLLSGLVQNSTVNIGTPTVSSPLNSTCSVPKFVGNWEQWLRYPIAVAESQGALVGDDFIVVSGFASTWRSVTRQVYAFNVKMMNAVWRRMDDVPVPGFTHAGYIVVGRTMYICGAYVGGVPGPDSKTCLMFTPAALSGQQWSILPEMPEGRGGGGINHIKETNSIIYSAGATRRNGTTIDHNTTYELYLDNLAQGWIKRADIPYKGNHISHVTAYYQGKPRYFWAGGQVNENEHSGNQKDLVEWDQDTKTWIRHANMTLARGHASSSTVAYGCGFLMIGGAINSNFKYGKTADISYYGIDSNTWTKIGDLPSRMNTPICDIVRGVNNSDWVYCQTGPISSFFNWRRRISL